MADPQQDAANREALLNRLLAGGRIGPAPVASHPQPLEDDDEAAFQQWYAKAAKQFNLAPSPDDPRHFYDYRGAYKAGAWPDASKHWPSEYKLEGHPELIVGGRDTRIGKPIVEPVASHPARDAVIVESTRKRKVGAPTQQRRELNETPEISLGEMRGIENDWEPGFEKYGFTRSQMELAQQLGMQSTPGGEIGHHLLPFLAGTLDDVAKKLGKPPGWFKTVVEKLPSGTYRVEIREGPLGLSAGSISMGDQVVRGHLSVDLARANEGLRGKGLGREMYQEAINAAKQHGYSGLASDPAMRNQYSERI